MLWGLPGGAGIPRREFWAGWDWGALTPFDTRLVSSGSFQASLESWTDFIFKDLVSAGSIVTLADYCLTCSSSSWVYHPRFDFAGFACLFVHSLQLHLIALQTFSTGFCWQTVFVSNSSAWLSSYTVLYQLEIAQGCTGWFHQMFSERFRSFQRCFPPQHCDCSRPLTAATELCVSRTEQNLWNWCPEQQLSHHNIWQYNNFG